MGPEALLRLRRRHQPDCSSTKKATSTRLTSPRRRHNDEQSSVFVEEVSASTTKVISLLQGTRQILLFQRTPFETKLHPERRPLLPFQPALRAFSEVAAIVTLSEASASIPRAPSLRPKEPPFCSKFLRVTLPLFLAA